MSSCGALFLCFIRGYLRFNASFEMTLRLFWQIAWLEKLLSSKRYVEKK